MRSVASTAVDDRLVSTGYSSRVDDALHITPPPNRGRHRKVESYRQMPWQCIVRWGQFR